MVFSSYVFLFLFLPITCLVYFLPFLPLKGKNLWLLIVSLVFYGWTTPKFLLILLASIAINWTSGLLISKNRHRRAVLVISVLLNLSLLVFFKYANFIVDNLSVFAPSLKAGWTTIVLPLGISFFTFQGMSYVFDVYLGDGEALKNPLDVGLYISLFPQLVAGPIVRFKTIAEEIHRRTISVDMAGAGFRRFTYGLAKKVILADTFGQLADGVFDATSRLSTGNAWIGILAYTLQIYYDFSGYSDMAIGLGSIFGFHFLENFNYPYISRSVTEFWRRWHISLSTWFRDYVYIPCGGSRVPRARHIFNIFLVWLLTGIWHGANWTFICWGIYYGILLLIEKFIIGDRLRLVPSYLRWGVTLLLVMLGWVFFRASSITAAVNYIHTMFVVNNAQVSYMEFMRKLSNYGFFWLLGCIGIFPVKNLYARLVEKIRPAGWVLAVVENAYVAVLFVLSVVFIVAGSYNAFIYFQF